MFFLHKLTQFPEAVSFFDHEFTRIFVESHSTPILHSPLLLRSVQQLQVTMQMHIWTKKLNSLTLGALYSFK